MRTPPLRNKEKCHYPSSVPKNVEFARDGILKFCIHTFAQISIPHYKIVSLAPCNCVTFLYWVQVYYFTYFLISVYWLHPFKIYT